MVFFALVSIRGEASGKGFLPAGYNENQSYFAAPRRFGVPSSAVRRCDFSGSVRIGIEDRRTAPTLRHRVNQPRAIVLGFGAAERLPFLAGHCP